MTPEQMAELKADIEKAREDAREYFRFLAIEIAVFAILLAIGLGSAKGSALDYNSLSLPVGELNVDPAIASSDLEQARSWSPDAIYDPADLVCYTYATDQPDDCAPKAEPYRISWVSDLGGIVNPPYVPNIPKMEMPEPDAGVFIVLGIVGLFLGVNEWLDRRKK
jgi:hypothetical protein